MSVGIIQSLPQVDFKTYKEIEEFVAKVADKYQLDNYKVNSLKNTLVNEMAFLNAEKLTNSIKINSPVVGEDIDVYKTLAFTVITKFYVSSIIDKIAKVYPIKSIVSMVPITSWTYGDDYAPENIKKGDKLSQKRSKTYSKVQELEHPRSINYTVNFIDIKAQVRKITEEFTFEALLNTASFMTKEQLIDFVNREWTGIIVAKLKDEIELQAMDLLVQEAAIRTDYTPSNDDCDDCDAKKLVDVIHDVATEIYLRTSVYPNTVIIGLDAERILRKADRYLLEYQANPNQPVLPTGIARNYIGVLDNKFNVIYDPSFKGITVIARDMDVDLSPLVYAPYIPLGISKPIATPDMSTSRTIFSVDAIKVVYPELIGYISIS